MTDGHPLAGRRFHMMGIAGAGVSALAQLAAAWGAEVSGCDRADSTYADHVRRSGIAVEHGHDAAHVTPGVELVRSSALDPSHPEVAHAIELGARVWLRGELLGQLTALRRTVVVAGAHGKSTTTGMIASAALHAGTDPSVAIGALMRGLSGGNVHAGSGAWFVVEGDESDRTLLHLDAQIAVVTNIERDHHHTFASDAEVEDLFASWIDSLAPGSLLIAGPDAACDRLVEAAGTHVEVRRFGRDDDQLSRLGRRLQVPGRHNALNAAAALAALDAMGVPPEPALSGVIGFRGVGRRFEVVGTSQGVTVVDDYAHHPTEVAATISAARSWIADRGGPGRLVVIFQPHLYSRTQELHERFAAALAGADLVWLLPIYGARESAIDGVTSQLIADAHAASRGGGGVLRLLDVAPATGSVATLCEDITSGDLVMTMGAGDITKLAPRLLAGLGQPVVGPDS